jgi:hypothetical protein
VAMVELVSAILSSRLSIHAFLFFFIISPSSHLAPGSVTKPLQEETKEETKKQTKKKTKELEEVK